MGSQARICIVDGDPAVRDSLATLIDLSGEVAEFYASGAEFLAALDNGPIACVVCEAELPDARGLDVFTQCRQRHPTARFALLTSSSDPAQAAAAHRRGVDDVFPKPFVNRRLGAFLRRG